MDIIKSHLNVFAILASVFVAGIIILISGIVSFCEYSSPTDIYNVSYKEYLIEDIPVKGDVWCVEACFAETENYGYALIPAVDESTFIEDEVLKFVVLCYDKSRKDDFSAMADYWNGITDTVPADISFSGIISKTDDSSVSHAVYEYFELEYGFSHEETDQYYLPYVITEIDSFAYAYLPKIIVGAVFMALSVILFIFMKIRFSRKDNEFTLNDIPQ
ncbi:MAG: hypothetical protein IJO29_00195 [Oscillospiraceae bacterium]|nr:hypothetical protein [Oscillospiraceae bacterium]